MNTIPNGLVEGKAPNETLYLVHRGCSDARAHCLRSERPRLSEWRNGNLVRYALGFPLLNVTIWAAGIKLISDLMLPAAVCNGIGGAWTVAVLLPLAKVILAPAEGQGETIMRERFQVIEGGRKTKPVVLDTASKGALAAGLKLIDPRKQPAHYEAMAEAYARMLREERAA